VRVETRICKTVGADAASVLCLFRGDGGGDLRQLARPGLTRDLPGCQSEKMTCGDAWIVLESEALRIGARNGDGGGCGIDERLLLIRRRELEVESAPGTTAVASVKGSR
jgi:hypothetical protein